VRAYLGIFILPCHILHCHMANFTVSLETIPNIFSWNLSKCCPILIMFGNHFKQKQCNQLLVYFPPQLNNASTLTGRTDKRHTMHVHDWPISRFSHVVCNRIVCDIGLTNRLQHACFTSSLKPQFQSLNQNLLASNEVIWLVWLLFLQTYRIIYGEIWQ